MRIVFRHTLARWLISIGTVSASVASISALTALYPGAFDISSSATADTAARPHSQAGSPSLGFSDVSGGPTAFIDTLELEEGESQLVDLAATGLLIGTHDVLQVLIGHDPGVVEVTGATCSGLFDGGFGATGPVVVGTGQVAFMCGIEGGMAEASGVVMQVELTRVGAGDTVLELLEEGAFGTQLFSAGVGTILTLEGALLVQEPFVPPTPTPPPTVTPTATTTSPPPSSGGGGGAAFSPPAPTPTPSVSVPGIPTALTVVPGDGQVELSWSPPLSNGGTPVNEYLVRSADGQINRLFNVPPRPVVISGLENGKEYSFRVQARNAIGGGPFTDLSEPVVPAGPPTVPLDLSATVVADGGAVTLEWLEPADSNGAEIDYYNVVTASGPANQSMQEVDGLSALFSGLAPGEYIFSVTARSRGGTSEPAEVTVIVPPTLESPVEPETPAEPAVAERQETNPALVEASDQIKKATGATVVLIGSVARPVPEGEALKLVLPVEIDSEEAQQPAENEFDGFSLDNLTVESAGGRPSTAVFSLDDGVEIHGSVNLSADAEGINAELHNMILRISAPQSTGEQPNGSFVIETPVSWLDEIPDLTVSQLDEAGVLQLIGSQELVEALLDEGWAIPPDSPGTEIVGEAWAIEHTAALSLTGDTVFWFTANEGRLSSRSLMAVKQGDDGAVYVRRARCERDDSGSVRCSALFDGEAGGLSTFLVLEVESATVAASGDPNPDAPRPVEASEPESQSERVMPAAQTESSTAGPMAPPTRMPVGTPTLAADDAVVTDTPDDVGFVDPARDDGSTVVVVIALSAVGLVVVAGLGGYAARHMRAGPRPGISSLAAGFTAASLLMLISTSGDYVANASGSVDTQGDVAQRSDLLRNGHGVDGSGITIGIISDSIGCDSSALAADLAAGELPAAIAIESDASSILCSFAQDRGRAMAQIVHDVAPGADIVFHSAMTGKDELTFTIESLAASGADIILEDVIFADELIYQDDIVAQAIDDVTASGVIYVASAGAPGMESYQAEFVPGGSVGVECGSASSCTSPGDWHDFDPGPGVDQLIEINLTDSATSMALYWNDPSELGGGPGTTSDMDLYVFDESGDLIEVGNTANIVDQQPKEAVLIREAGTVQVAISHRAGTVPGEVKLVAMNGASINEFSTDSSTIIGHRNAAGAITVGPVNFANTSAFGGVPRVERDAPSGGAEILFDGSGNALSVPLVRQKPDLVAPSGVDTTLGAFDGSSAAAAHAAGVVALLLELRHDLHSNGQLGNEVVRTVLTQSAVEVGDPGPDLQSGFGLVDAVAAADLLLTEPPVAVDDAYTVDTGELLSVDAPGVLANDLDQDVSGLTAKLVAAPANGTVTLESDGSFTYSPVDGFVGDDTFTYVADDGTFSSAPAVVTIAVTGIESVISSVTLQGVGSGTDFGLDTIRVVLSNGLTTAEASLTPGADPSFLIGGMAPGSYTLSASMPGFLDASIDVLLGDEPGTPTPVGPNELPAGDANSDGLIDSTDAAFVAGAFGFVHSPGDRTAGSSEITDLNGDGVTNGTDASLTISNIGLTAPQPWIE